MLVHIFLFQLNSKTIFPSDPGVYFTSGLSDVTAVIGTDAELVCRLSSEECDGVWYKNGKEVRNLRFDRVIAFTFNLLKFKCVYMSVCEFQITATDDICIVKEGTYRKLIIKNCQEDDAAKYRCEADGRKTEAMLNVEGTVIRIDLRNYNSSKKKKGGHYKKKKFTTIFFSVQCLKVCF